VMADELMWVCVWVSNVCVLRQGRKSSGTLDGKGKRGWSQVTRDRKAEVAMMTIGNKERVPDACQPENLFAESLTRWTQCIVTPQCNTHNPPCIRERQSKSMERYCCLW